MNFKQWLLSEYDQNLHKDIDTMILQGLSYDNIVQTLKDQNRWPKDKAAKQLKLSIKRKVINRSDDFKQKKLWGNLNDEQILQNTKQQFDIVSNYLLNIGAKLEKESPISNSLYYILPNQEKVRLSDHQLPYSDERSFYASINPRHEIIIDKFRTPNETKNWIRNYFQEIKNESDQGSVNYLNAKSNGMVEGEPKYASYEPHHKKTDGGAWIYTNMYNPHIEDELKKFMENPHNGMEVEDLFVIWSEKEGLRLMQNAGGVFREIPFPNKGEHYFINDDPDYEKGDDYYYYGADVVYDNFLDRLFKSSTK